MDGVGRMRVEGLEARGHEVMGELADLASGGGGAKGHAYSSSNHIRVAGMSKGRQTKNFESGDWEL